MRAPVRLVAVLVVGAVAGAALSGCAARSTPDAVTVTETVTAVTTATATRTSMSTMTVAAPTTTTATVTAVTTTTATVRPTVSAAPARTPPTGAGADAAAATPQDPDLPGPTGGPPCPSAPTYSNEPPTGLAPAALAAWKRAVAAAAEDGIALCLNDGKRSRAQQRAIYQAYVRDYGRAAADRLVLPPGTSRHVTGLAIDVQPSDAHRWLQATDGSFGWCRIYDNEPWHFEYSRDYVIHGCPARLAAPQR